MHLEKWANDVDASSFKIFRLALHHDTGIDRPAVLAGARPNSRTVIDFERQFGVEKILVRNDAIGG